MNIATLVGLEILNDRVGGMGGSISMWSISPYAPAAVTLFYLAADTVLGLLFILFLLLREEPFAEQFILDPLCFLPVTGLLEFGQLVLQEDLPLGLLGQEFDIDFRQKCRGRHPSIHEINPYKFI